MHELSIAQSILDTIEQTLGGKQPLLTVTLTIGPFAGVSADALDFCFTELARQQDFGEPNLIINPSPATLHCSDCGQESPIDDPFGPCPRCGSPRCSILDGRDCTIDSVEIEENSHESQEG